MAAYPIVADQSEEEQLRALYRMLLRPGHPHLVSPEGFPQEIPETVYKILVQVVARMQEGKAIAVFPVMEELTTKAAANILGVSRQFLVRMLEAKKIPFHKAGTHRRIYLKDVLDFQKKRDQDRHDAIRRIARKEVEEGTYDTFGPPSEE
jgi:excisionase family DNA binding protein